MITAQAIPGVDREFIKHHPTVYLFTHTPQGYENLEGRRVVDLNNPPETIPLGEATFKTATGKYVCSVCGYVYDPVVGDPTRGIPLGTAFEVLPDDWRCPRCKNPKKVFNKARVLYGRSSSERRRPSFIMTMPFHLLLRPSPEPAFFG